MYRGNGNCYVASEMRRAFGPTLTDGDVITMVLDLSGSEHGILSFQKNEEDSNPIQIPLRPDFRLAIQMNSNPSFGFYFFFSVFLRKQNCVSRFEMSQTIK